MARSNGVMDALEVSLGGPELDQGSSFIFTLTRPLRYGSLQELLYCVQAGRIYSMREKYR
jgi:hypothetical protein